MVSRENALVGASVLLAVVLWYGLTTYTDAPDWALWVVILGVGVLLPMVIRAQERR
jgi:hypothetical protein